MRSRALAYSGHIYKLCNNNIVKIISNKFRICAIGIGGVSQSGLFL
jgi:hypothetical protein